MSALGAERWPPTERGRQMAAEKKPAHQATAERILAKLPKAVRDEAEVEQGGGEYHLLKVGGKTVASVRNRNVRVTFRHGGTAAEADALAKVVADAAATKAPAPAKEEKQEAGESAD